MSEVGIDIIEIYRIERAIQRHGDRFLERVFTAREISLYHNKTNSLTARFAAKEAVMKLLGGGIYHWHDIEILNDVAGKPQLTLYGEAQVKAAGLKLNIAVSLSHSKEYAVAVAVSV